MAIRPEWGDDIQPMWATYFSVDDCDACVERAVALGASLLAPSLEIPDVGRFAWLADPRGAAFAVIRLVER